MVEMLRHYYLDGCDTITWMVATLLPGTKYLHATVFRKCDATLFVAKTIETEIFTDSFEKTGFQIYFFNSEFTHLVTRKNVIAIEIVQYFIDIFHLRIVELLAVLPLQLHPCCLADPVPVLVDGREPRGRPVLAAPGVAEGVDADHGVAVVQTAAGVALGFNVYAMYCL